jgi:hypothetical protein
MFNPQTFLKPTNTYIPQTQHFIYKKYSDVLRRVSTDSTWSGSGFQYLITFAVPKLQLTARI